MIPGHIHVSKGLRAVGQTGSLDGRSKLRQMEEGPNHKERQNKFLKKIPPLALLPSFLLFPVFLLTQCHQVTEGLFLGTGLPLEMSDRVTLCLHIYICSPGWATRLVSHGLCQYQSRQSAPFSLLTFVLDVLEEKSWHFEDDYISLAKTLLALCVGWTLLYL